MGFRRIKEAYEQMDYSLTLLSCIALKIFTSRSCDAPILDRSGQIGVLQGVLTPIQDVLFFFRIANKLLNVSTWGADDTTIVIAWVSLHQPLPKSFNTEQGGNRNTNLVLLSGSYYRMGFSEEVLSVRRKKAFLSLFCSLFSFVNHNAFISESTRNRP